MVMAMLVRFWSWTTSRPKKTNMYSYRVIQLRRVKEIELGKISGGKKNRKENPFELFVDF